MTHPAHTSRSHMPSAHTYNKELSPPTYLPSQHQPGTRPCPCPCPHWVAPSLPSIPARWPRWPTAPGWAAAPSLCPSCTWAYISTSSRQPRCPKRSLQCVASWLAELLAQLPGLELGGWLVGLVARLLLVFCLPRAPARSVGGFARGRTLESMLSASGPLPPRFLWFLLQPTPPWPLHTPPPHPTLLHPRMCTCRVGRWVLWHVLRVSGTHRTPAGPSSTITWPWC